MPKVKKVQHKGKAKAAVETNLIDYHHIVATGNLGELNKHLSNGIKGFNR